MPKPYDAVSKSLITLRPADWVAFLGLPPGDVSVEDADLSAVSAFADKLIRVDGADGSYLVHNELETGKDTGDIPLRLLRYNAPVLYKMRLPVVSTVFLMHKESNSPQITGALDVPGANRVTYFSFRYNVVRVWQLDPDELLAGGLSLLPFAPIANVYPAEVPGIVRMMRARIDAEAKSDEEAGELWTATNVLMGLRYNESFKNQVLQGVRRMRESNSYKAIVSEGEAIGELREARKMVLRAGMRRLGEASPETIARMETINVLDTLESLVDRLVDLGAETWDDLLAGVVTTAQPKRPPHNPRRRRTNPPPRRKSA